MGGGHPHSHACLRGCLPVYDLSAYGFAPALGPNVVLDPSRVAHRSCQELAFSVPVRSWRAVKIVRGLTTAASIWTVAAIGLAVGGGLYFAAGVSTAVILAILAGVKPLEQMYRERNQSCRFVVEATHGSLTPDVVKRTLGVRAGQIKRFVVKPGETADVDEVTVILTRVASQDTQAFAEKLQNLPYVNQVSIVTRRDDRALLDVM